MKIYALIKCYKCRKYIILRLSNKRFRCIECKSILNKKKINIIKIFESAAIAGNALRYLKIPVSERGKKPYLKSTLIKKFDENNFKIFKFNPGD